MTGGLVTTLLVASLSAAAYADGQRLTLARAVPDDVFLYVGGRHNPEREFLDRYWGEVFETLKQCGIGQDLMELIASQLEAEQMGEVDRLKERASQLLSGVDWEQLAGGEVVFAERMNKPISVGDEFHMLPDMVWLFRGGEESAAKNYDGLVAILQTIAAEINKAAGLEGLTVDTTPRKGAKVSSLNLLDMVHQAPPLVLAVALHGDVIVIAMGDEILDDVVGLLAGKETKKPLSASPRFKQAFAKLPEAEDEMTFFDMQAMLVPFRTLSEEVVAQIGSGRHDVITNARFSDEADRIAAKGVEAYERKDYKQALEYTKQAHEAAPTDSRIMYNLACFHALSGHKTQAAEFLQRAVDGGFYAPTRISEDQDLESLRHDQRYRFALAKATQMAARYLADDIVLNSTKSGKAHELNMQAWKAYEQKEYEQGLKLVEKAHELAPDDSRVLYYLACFHALSGNTDKAIGFLQKAVDGGFYCPRHISKDADLESIRGDNRYEAALATARENAAQVGARKAADEAAVVKRISGRLMDAAGILDYSATVKSTDGYSVRAETIACLVPDAKSRPIYPVFGKRASLTDFDRYLPQETVSFSVCGGPDLGELYRFIEDTFRVAGPKGEALLAKWTQLQAGFGFDVKKDVIGWIDGDSVSVTLEDDKGSVFMVKVTNEQVARQKVTAAIDFLSTRLSEVMAKNPALAMLTVTRSPVQHEQLEGFENLHFVMSPRPIVWGVADNHLIFGTSADAVAMCLQTAKGDHPGIRKNARVMSEALVPAGPFASVALTDQRGLGQELATGIGIISAASGMVTMGIPDPEVRQVISKIAGMIAKLTPVVSKIDFYKSTAAVTTYDGHAWHTRAVTHYVPPEERTKSELP